MHSGLQKWMMQVLLILSCLLIAGCGKFASWFGKTLEDVFVLSSGLANSLALIAISGKIYREEKTDQHRVQKRALLIIETLLFCAILGSDIQRFFDTDSFRFITLVLALVLGIVPPIFLVFVKDPKKYIGGLVTALLFSISLFIVPALFDRITIHMPSYVEQRNNSFIHLLIIPIIYLISDSVYSQWDSSWKKLCPLDIGLCIIALACVAAGFSINEPKFEAGAAAVIMLVSNWWFMNIAEQS